MSHLYQRITALSAAVLISSSALFSPFAFADSPAEVPTVQSTPAANSAPLPPPAAATQEIVSNPYGLDALWREGDFVARGTLVILVLMSIGSWYIIITKLLAQSKLQRESKGAKKTFWQAESVDAGIKTLKPNGAYLYIAQTGNKSTVHHDGALLERIDLNTWITLSIQRAVDKVKSRLNDGLAFLATVGSTAPFVGLFGTVWGIYHALTAIGIAGQASIDKVAGPVGEALIMTAIGLAVAVPAVLGYNWLVRRNKSALEGIREFSDDLHSVLLSGAMSTSSVSISEELKQQPQKPEKQPQQQYQKAS